MITDVPGWFAKLMVIGAETCPGTRLTEAQIRAYWSLLGPEFTEEQLTRAMPEAIKDGNGFLPSVAALRRQIVPSTDDVGLLAWDGLQRAASHVGAYGSLTCEDGAVARAVELVFGSWAQLCAEAVDIPTAGWLARRQEFLAAYRTVRRHRVLGAEPVRLVGLCEQGDAIERHAQTWGGRLLATGDLVTERDRQAISAAPTVAALPAASDFDEPLID